MTPDHLRDLVEHLARSRALGPEDSLRLVEEVIAYFGESPDQFVARRHAELQGEGLRNAEIFARLEAELSARRFAAPSLSERQIRRMVYG